MSSNCEVVISPPAVYLQGVAASIRPDIALSAQVCVYYHFLIHTYESIIQHVYAVAAEFDYASRHSLACIKYACN
jgi:hypothetical protein